MVSVERIWNGETVVIIASGPSLTQVDVDVVRGQARVIVVNDNYRMAPWADLLYAYDAAWWEKHHASIQASTFRGLRYTADPDAAPYASVLNCIHRDGLTDDPTAVHAGGHAQGHSGFQAINLAVHCGVSRIVLLGYDCQKGPKGQTHWFGNHPTGLSNNSPLAGFKRALHSLVGPLAKRGIAVVNCTRSTAVTSFPRAPITDVFPVRWQGVA